MPNTIRTISKSTKLSMDQKVNRIVTMVSKQYNLEPALIFAFIYKESGRDITALRYEPHLRRAKWYLNTLTQAEKTNDFCFYSMGLMQIMFGVAKADYGFKGEPFELMAPSNSILYGVKHLKRLFKRYNLEDGISSYNQGSPRKLKNGTYKNQDYVDRVLKYYKKFKKKLP